MIEKYIEENRFNRTKFAIDVKNLKITKSEIYEVLSAIDKRVGNGEIESPYLGNTSSYVIKKSAWNKNYQDYLLAEISSSELFNKDSILYLYEVSEYVSKSTKRLFIRLIGCLLVALFLFLSGYFLGKKNANTVRVIPIQPIEDIFEE